MKKSILMAIVALALLAAPAFAGDYSIVGNIDWGFGATLGNSPEDLSGNDIVTNDYTQLGFSGSIDDFNQLSITMEYGASGGAAEITSGNGVSGSVWLDDNKNGVVDATDGDGVVDDGETFSTASITGGNPGGLWMYVTDFHLTSDLLGSMGVTDIPVTLTMDAGFGRLNLHNRFQQWTGWEVKRWKDHGTAHFAGSYSADDPGAWSRATYLKFTVGIMGMVNVSYGFVPQLQATTTNAAGDVVADIPQMIDVWTSGIVVGPAALDIAANLRLDNLQMRTGLQVTANMNFGALGLMAFVGEDYKASTDAEVEDKGFDNAVIVAVKPTYNFGAGSVSLGLWYEMNSVQADIADADVETTHAVAVDVALSYATFTVYGGVLMTDLTDNDENDESPMKYDIGVKNSFGAATVGLGITGIAGVEDGTGTAINNHDIGAADGTGSNWTDADDNAAPTMYFRVSAWY